MAKEPLGTKGARLTSHATMPGRFLVFMPTVDHVGVSRKIDSREERSRLRGIVREFREQHGFTGGVIIRTAAGRPPEGGHRLRPELLPQDLDRDPPEVRNVARAGGRLSRAEPGRQAAARPAHRGVPAIRIDNEHEYRRVLELVERIMPTLARGEALREAESRSSRNTACRPRSTRRCAARCG